MLHVTSKLRAIAVSALMAFALIACGSATTSTTAPATSAPSSSQPAATSASAETTAEAAAPAPTAASDSGASQPTSQQSETPATTTLAAAKLNLNELTEAQLMSTIPNFSTRMVREFMEYRPYISIQQFRKEIGKYVSAEEVATYEQYVYVPIDVDQADAATLQQLPGVDENIANALIAGRPYGSNQAFLDKLAGSVSATDLQQAAAYLVAK